MNLVYDNSGSLPLNATAGSAQANKLVQGGVMTNKFGHRTVQLALQFYF
jgi:hypothetical protein